MISSQEVPQGYKRTKIGVIPDEWKEYSFNDIFIFSTGKSIKQNEASPEFSIPCVRYGELYHMYNEIITKVINKTNLDKSELLFSKGNEILLPSAGEDPLDIGSASALTLKDIAIGRTINILRPSKENIYSQEYMAYFINHQLKRKIASLAKGSSISNVYNSDLKKIKVPLPPIKEQQKIAKILTTWDDAVSKQEDLIKVKEQLKKGLMQKLLSGEVQFDGFNGEWEEVRLGNICKITTGKLNANAMIENGKYTFFTCAKESYKIDIFAFDTEALLVSGNGANVGYIHYFKGKFNAYQRTYVLDKFQDNIMLIKYLLDKYLSFQINREKNDGNTPYITLPTLTKMKLKLPPLQEQQKIAQVLSTADKEIELLKNELESLKEQKKGLMQKLLTGEVRVTV